MTESNEQSQAGRIELSFTQDSNDPALSKIIPILPHSKFAAELKLCRKEPQSIFFERNDKCEPVLCNKSCSKEELKAHLLALAKKWMHQTLYTEFMAVVTDECNSYALTKIHAIKIIDNNNKDELLEIALKLRDRLDKDRAAMFEQKIADTVDNKFGQWIYKSTSPVGSALIYDDVRQLMLSQSKKMGVCLNDVVRYMTLVIPAQVIPFFTANKGIFSSAYDMLKFAFPELKIITIPELAKDKKQFALLLCDDPAYGKPGYLVLRDGQPIKAFKPEDCITTIKYNLAIPQHKLVITNPEQIAVLEGI